MPDQMQRYTLTEKRPRSGPDPLLTFLQQNTGKPVVLDVGQVDRIDSQRLRTLLSAQLRWARDGQPLSLDAVSDRFRLGLQHLGLSPKHFEPEER